MMFSFIFFVFPVLFLVFVNHSVFDYQYLFNRSIQSRIIISSVNIDIPVIVPENINIGAALRRSAYKLPKSGDPLIGGNMIVVGHRLRAGAPLSKSFYNLPKIKKGDLIIINWLGHDYKYRVDTVTIEESTYEVEVLTDAKMLTLVTCTPLESSTHRLIVKAVQYEDY